jgi:hypothetical protein
MDGSGHSLFGFDSFSRFAGIIGSTDRNLQEQTK